MLDTLSLLPSPLRGGVGVGVVRLITDRPPPPAFAGAGSQSLPSRACTRTRESAIRVGREAKDLCPSKVVIQALPTHLQYTSEARKCTSKRPQTPLFSGQTLFIGKAPRSLPKQILSPRLPPAIKSPHRRTEARLQTSNWCGEAGWLGVVSTRPSRGGFAVLGALQP